MLIVCKQCGQEVKLKDDELKRHKGFCSKECRNLFYTRACDWCGKEFVATSCLSRYCSRVCNARAAENMSKIKRKTKPAPLEIKKCGYCGKSFTPKLSTQRYCCNECRVYDLRKDKPSVEERIRIVQQIDEMAQERILIHKRRCHDCGTPTYNYRCEKCWRKHRQKYGGSLEGIGEYCDEL